MGSGLLEVKNDRYVHVRRLAQQRYFAFSDIVVALLNDYDNLRAAMTQIANRPATTPMADVAEMKRTAQSALDGKPVEQEHGTFVVQL